MHALFFIWMGEVICPMHGAIHLLSRTFSVKICIISSYGNAFLLLLIRVRLIDDAELCFALNTPLSILWAYNYRVVCMCTSIYQLKLLRTVFTSCNYHSKSKCDYWICAKSGRCDIIDKKTHTHTLNPIRVGHTKYKHSLLVFIRLIKTNQFINQ